MRPIRAISPSRRAAHREVTRWCGEPGYLDSYRMQLMRRIWREHAGVDDPLAGLNEAALFRRIFGRETGP
ncbi:hypothetical protein ACIRYZ_09190 [Kitasatospora sp. NPDC101155]|uniref:hypothetical protein n=1 Tax=Kitasatospora sp. NPDC101155 TaxID=3364097 RepID=UPI00380E536D